MDWDGIGLGDRVLTWLEATGQSRQTKERRLDPFATSMRDLDDVTVDLQSVRSGQQLERTDQVQRITDLRSTGLVEGSVDAALLTELGNATLDSWLKYGVANGLVADEFARTMLLVHEGQRLGVGIYLAYIDYWAELRASFDAYKLINNWDALFTLNYLDNEINGFAPGSALRDEKVPVESIDYDLDEYVDLVGASKAARTGADQVARAIEGKIPRGRARATLCIVLELMAAPQTDPRIMLQAFGHPKRPRQWAAFNESQIEKIVAILADFGIAAVPGSGNPISAELHAKDTKPAFQLPPEINFEGVFHATPRPPKKQASAVGGGPKKIDHRRRQERNDFVGRLGEEFAIRYEQWRLRDHPELVKQIEHVSLEDDTLGYDIRSFEIDGTRRLVEVKATQGPLETRFFMSAWEKAFADAYPAEYVVMRVGNLKDGPILCELRPPFDEVEFLPSVFEVHFLPEEDKE